MKIKDEHFEILKEACEKVLNENPNAREHYVEAGYSPMRFRWDVLWAAKIDDQPVSYWITDNLYPYMTDTHIDTALRRIVD